MDTIRCKAFLTAANLGSMRAAAEELGYTTPGISHLIASLEDDLGFPLLGRKKTGVYLTAEGRRFIPLAQSFIKQEEAILQFAHEVKGVLTGSIDIAAYPSIVAHLLPPLLAGFHEAYPNVEVSVTEKFREDALFGLEEGFYDLAFISSGGPIEQDWIPLCQDELVVALPKDHPLAKRKTFPAKQLEQESFIMPGMYAVNDASVYLESHGMSVSPVCTSESNAGALGLVKHGVGVTLLYRLSTTNWDRDVALLPLSPQEKIWLGIACPSTRTLSPAAYRLVQMAQEILGADK